MRRLNRPLGCGLWLVWLALGLFAGEWLLLWATMQWVPAEGRLAVVIGIIVITVVVGWVAVYFRLHRRAL
jgi:hypothetical protein